MRYRLLRRGAITAQKFIFTGAPVVSSPPPPPPPPGSPPPPPPVQAPPVVVANTPDLLQITSSGATLGGTVNPNGDLTTYQIQWGLTTSYGSVASDSAGLGTTPVAVSTVLTGTPSSTTYHWRITATNSGGTSVTPDQTFTTQASPSIAGTYANLILAEPGLIAYYRLDEIAPASPPPPVGLSAPTNTTLPTISGTISRGQMLVASNGAWNNAPPSFTYQWQRNSAGTWAAIAGATQQFYTLAKADNGALIRVLVTAANSVGSATATSAATTASVDAVPVFMVATGDHDDSHCAAWASRGVNCVVAEAGGIASQWNISFRASLVAADMYAVRWGYDITDGVPVASNTNGIAADASDSRIFGWQQPDEAELGQVFGSFTGTIAQGSNQITGVSSTSGLANGQYLAAVGIRLGTTISSISGSTITMSQGANIPAGQPTSNVAVVATGGRFYYSVSQLVYLYNLYKTASSTKPVYLNFYGGFNAITSNSAVNYPARIAASDVVAEDIYPMNDNALLEPWIDLSSHNPTKTGGALDQLAVWTSKPKAPWIEAVNIGLGAPGPTSQETRGEAWDAIVHGANGIIWWTINNNTGVTDATTAAMQTELTANNALLTKYGRVFQTAPTRLTTTQAPVPFEGSTWTYLGHSFMVVLNMHNANSTWTDGSAFQPWEVRIYMDGALQDSRSAQLGT